MNLAHARTILIRDQLNWSRPRASWLVRSLRKAMPIR